MVSAQRLSRRDPARSCPTGRGFRSRCNPCSWEHRAVESPEHEKRAVSDYLLSQLPDETIEHAEKYLSEWVGGVSHDVWDVQTDGGRWWVVTNPTNFYPHD